MAETTMQRRAVAEAIGENVTVLEPRAAELDPVGYTRRRKLVRAALGVAVPVALVLLWELASKRGWISQREFPPPSRIAEKFWHMVTGSGTITIEGQEVDDSRIYGIFGDPPPTFWDLVWITTKRILIGFTIGSLAGVIVGFVMGSFSYVRAALEPLFNALYTVPKLALTPVFFAVWSIRDDKPMYSVVAITTFFFIWISTMSAMLSIAEGYREAASSFRVSRWKMFRHVTMPASVPQIAVGVRIAAGVAVLTTLSIELLLGANGSGIGTMIFNSKDLQMYDQMYVGIFTSALMGVVFTAAVSWLTARMAPWAPNARAMKVL
ncbi:MAG TPA: ABC transporter permease [Acidimicrobiales bacterium]